MPHTELPTGVSLYHKWHGEPDGVPVVFIRGTGADSTRWLPQVEEYKSRYRCLIFDNRGAGKSDAPSGPYTVEMMADDTLALLDALEVERAHLSGLSLGGAIAMHIAITNPERVRTLQLHGAWAKTEGYAQLSLGLLKRLVEAGGTDLYYEGALPYLFPPDYLSDNFDQVMEVLEMMKANASAPDGLLGQLDANLTHDVKDRLSEVKAPTLVTVGNFDMCLPPRYSQELAAGIPDAELVVFEGGHLYGIEDPEKFNEATLTWLYRKNDG